MDVQVLWLEYARSRDAELRQRLITHYWLLVKKVAGKLWKGLPSQVEMDDLVSYGTMGLIRAVENFDPYKGVAFETYAITAIRGAIYDELRSQDWAPRSLRRKQRLVEQTRSALEIKNGCEPSEEQIAERLEWEPAEVASVQYEVATSKFRSLDETLPAPSAEENTERVDQTADESGVLRDPAENAVERALMAAFVDTFKECSLQEQLVITLYYYENLTLSEVGELVGIPESRASQIHTRVVMALREQLQEMLAAVS